jgi:hypothetical protein
MHCYVQAPTHRVTPHSHQWGAHAIAGRCAALGGPAGVIGSLSAWGEQPNVSAWGEQPCAAWSAQGKVSKQLVKQASTHAAEVVSTGHHVR